MAVSQFIWIILGVSAVVVITGISTWFVTYENVKIDSKQNCKESDDTVLEPEQFTYGLIQNNYMSIESLDIYKNLTRILLKKDFDLITDFDYYKNNTIYYKASSNKAISSLSTDYPNLIKYDDSSSITNLAVDFKTKKVYAYDNKNEIINIFDMQGKYHGIVLSDLDWVTDLVLDPPRNMMFILSQSYKNYNYKSTILSANMDGKNLEIFISAINVTTLAVNVQTGSIYWGQNNDVMAKENYHSDKNLKVTTAPGKIISLAILDDSLYVVGDHQLDKLTNALFRCTLKSNICNNKLEIIHHGNIKKIRPYPRYRGSLPNPCAINNGGCDQLCVLSDFLNTEKGYSCACNIGWELKIDSRSCSPIDEYIIYVRGWILRGRIMDLSRESFSDAFIPTQLEMNQIQPIAYDYNAHKGYLIFTDEFYMHWVDLFRWYKQREIDEDYQFAMVPAIDWISDNLYYLKTHCFNNKGSYLMLRNGNNPSFNDYDRKTIYTFKEKQKPWAIVIHPALGTIYVTLYDEVTNKALICALDAEGNFKKFLETSETISINETSLAIDHEKKRLYWFNRERTAVQHVSFKSEDPSDLQTIDLKFIENPMYINVHREWIYVGNRSDSWQINKQTGEYARKIFTSKLPLRKQHELNAVKGYGVYLQPIPENHPCALDNGGCSHYCTVVYNTENGLKRLCLCNDNQRLKEDEKTCELKPTNM